MYYTGMALDRAPGRRDDPAWIGSHLSDPGAAIIPMWQERCLANGDEPVMVAGHAASDVVAAAGCVVFLGLDHQGARFAADLSALDESTALRLCRAERTVDARDLVPTLPMADAGNLAYARGILHWHRHQQFCGTCGGPTEPSHSGHQRSCHACGRELFPRIEPAVIVLVERADEPRRCVLARERGSDADRFSTLAGFLEVGESLEDAVRREVAEETGIKLGAVTYQGSQAWPFPAGLMVGFRALAESEQITIDKTELSEARWFTADEIRSRMTNPQGRPPFRIDSIGKHLVESWLADIASTTRQASTAR